MVCGKKPGSGAQRKRLIFLCVCISEGLTGNTLGKTERRNIMTKKKEKPIDLKNLETEEKMKYEIAEELGLLDRVLAHGWKSLTSKETGRIGGLVTKKKKEGR